MDVRKTVVGVLALAGLVVLPSVALAGGRGGTKPGPSTGSSVSLAVLDPAATSASFGDQVTFTVSTSVSTTWVNAKCFQAGALVYSETHGFYPSYPWGQTYTLGPTSLWQGGGADCSAELYTLDRRQRQVTLATTTFSVVP
jgi:hypothetical protein